VISQQIRQKTCPIRWAGNCGSPNWLEKNFIKVLVVTSPQRDSRLPNVPTLEEIAPADKKPLLEAMYSVQGRTFAMPPGDPPERVKILRDAFATMFKDRDFQQDVDKLGLE
jgi:tripartite-type tricarboxylate transporter receptor subunit TctC